MANNLKELRQEVYDLNLLDFSEWITMTAKELKQVLNNHKQSKGN